MKASQKLGQTSQFVCSVQCKTHHAAQRKEAISPARAVELAARQKVGINHTVLNQHYYSYWHESNGVIVSVCNLCLAHDDEHELLCVWYSMKDKKGAPWCYKYLLCCAMIV